MTKRFPVPDEAWGLQCWRIRPDNGLVLYYGTTFPKNPREGCATLINRFGQLGMLKHETEGESDYGIDIQDEDGTILDTYHINPKGVKYIRRVLKWKIESQDPIRPKE